MNKLQTYFISSHKSQPHKAGRQTCESGRALGRTYNGRRGTPKTPTAGFKNGRYRIEVYLNSNLDTVSNYKEYSEYKDAKNKVKGWKLKFYKNRFIADRAATFVHETFLHVEFNVQDYLDNGNAYDFNYTNNVLDHHEYLYKSKFTIDADNNITPVLNKTNKTYLINYEGWLAIKALHKWYGTGYTDKQILNRFYLLDRDDTDYIKY